MPNPIIPWLGGKRRLADTIIPRFPPHTCYVEVFAGGAALYFLRPPAEVEVINDVNGELVNLYRVVQRHLEEFVRQFKWALSSRYSDSLDFYDLGVGGIKAALEAAFAAGQAAQAKKRPPKTAKNAPESLRKYIECGNRIDGLIERLNSLRAMHAERASADAANWGYLGDLGSVEQLIGQATEYIGGPKT